MNKTKRKVIAISTAFAMALVLVGSLIPSIKSDAFSGHIYDAVDLTFNAPTVGTTYDDISSCVLTDVGTVSTTGVSFCKAVIGEDAGAGWGFGNYPATLQANTKYKASIVLQCESTDLFKDGANSVNISINGADVTSSFAINDPNAEGWESLFSELSLEKKPTLLINADFEATAAPAPDPKSDADPVTPATPTDNTSANTDKTASTPTATSTLNTATTTKAKAPKTADALPIVAISLVIVGAAVAVATTFVSVRNKK